jgi:RimJ/RimL family protein N-acetyltransferase
MQPALTPTRLVLRPLAADDGPHLADIFAGAEVRRYLFDNQEVPPASVAALVEENQARPAAGLGLWLICRDNHVIGCVGLQRVPPHTVEIYPAFEGEIETIIALKEDQWGAGYATEALGALLTYASDALNEPRLVALVDASNLASRALMQRCGFREIGAAQGLYPITELIAYESQRLRRL